MVNGIIWLLNNDLRPVANGFAMPVHNEQFAHALGHALNRPAILRVPATAMRLLMGNRQYWSLVDNAHCPNAWKLPVYVRWYDLEALADVIR